jgi:hypothetical protein
MGQYYKVIILAEKGTSDKEYIRFFINIWDGIKLLEHSYLKNPFVNAVEFLLSPLGPLYKSRIVWAGDYADEEDDSGNLYHLAENEISKEYIPKSENLSVEYKYIVNHTKKQYIDKNKYAIFHPLPLITAEGNGRGGGDYHGNHEDKIGLWSRDVISIEKELLPEYTEFEYKFGEMED